MRDVLADLLAALDEDGSVVLATVVRTWGSSPQPAGAAMLRRRDGRAVGSISGGCVEGATYEIAGDVERTGEPQRHRFEVSDDDAFAVGLTCGGTIEVHVERVDAAERGMWGAVAECLREGRSVSVATALPSSGGTVGPRRLLLGPDGLVGAGAWSADEVAALAVAAEDGGGVCGLPSVSEDAAAGEAFVAVLDVPPRMLVYGAVDFAAALTQQARLLGYRTTVCDARGVFATSERFPAADEVVVDWPHRHLEREVLAGRTDHRTAVCVLTHDEKFDVPLLTFALSRSELGYVGAMGSAATHERRVRRLAEAGVTGERLGRLRSPIGLHLGGRTPAETALAIAAEVTAERHGGSMRPLRGAATPIHGSWSPDPRARRA